MSLVESLPDNDSLEGMYMLNKKSAVLWLRGAGAFLVSCVFTISVGYYLGDKGYRWFPNMVDILLICLFAGLGCLLAAAVSKGVTQGYGTRRRVKKRIFWLCLMLVLVVAVHFVGSQMQKQTSLSVLSKEEFATMVSLHLEQLDSFDREMESLLKTMEGCPAFTTTRDQPLSAGDETALRQIWLSLYDYAFALDHIRREYQDWYGFDVSRSQRPFRVQSFLMHYGTDVILYEKALRIIETIKLNPNAVTFLNAPHPGSDVGEGSFSRFQLDLFGGDCGMRINAGRVYLVWLEEGLDARAAKYCGVCLPLWSTVQTRLAVLDRMGLAAHSIALMDADMELLRQGVSRVWFPAQKGVAQWMGDTRVRRPGRYLITQELQQELNETLEPGDVLLSRKNWYMSNVGLPGFWPHAILYVGQPDKLAAYFEDPAVSAHLKTLAGKEMSFENYMAERFGSVWQRYRAGTGTSDYHVIEAVKYGVLLNPMSKACGDYMVALRPKLDKTAKMQAIIQAFSHLDKPYDFDFDFATDHALVCTELVWRSYRPGQQKQGIRFTLKEIGGRKTLPANEIAKLYRDQKENGEGQFDFIAFVDASEDEQKAYFSDEAAFVESVDRQKWSFLQE